MMHAMLALVAALQGQQAQGAERPTALQPPVPSAEALANDTGSLRHASGRPAPIAHGLRITGAAPRVDGHLDDAIWASAVPITDLFQNEPHEGQPASERTEVRIVYDDEAIYVGARMFDSQPRLIRSQLGRRDNTGNSDMFQVAFDSYHDHRSSFQFSVNPSGVRADAVTNSDNTYGDDSWDPVWEAKTQVDSLGWTAEMRIPFSQLRFSQAAIQTWGVNVSRYIQRKAESSEFAWKGQTDRGYASYFGHLFGLANLPQPRRLELLPYTTARNETGPSTPGDPFHDGSRAAGAAGMDLKYGLTSNLTVDATFNPDFGQVDQDPAYVNLSAFEQYLQERRPFFVEGADIFNFGGQQFFYSRRIGSPPHGFPSTSGFVDTPDNSTIIGASKLTGRTAGGWSIGLLEAMTAREYATIDSSGVRSSQEVEPLTNYAIARLKRDLRGGATTVGAMFTAVNRNLRNAVTYPYLRQSAYAGGLDFTHRFAHNRYSLSGAIAGSYIGGDTTAILAAQTSSARYYQRPDAGYVEVDSTRTSLSGYSGSFSFSKVQGSFTWGANARVVSPGFEVNDAGFTTRVDQRSGGLFWSRRWTRPGKVFRSANFGGNLNVGWNFGGVRTNNSGGMYGYGQFRNYWSLNASLYANGRALSDVLTRGGPLGYAPAGINGFIGVNTDYRKMWQVFVGSYYFTNDLGTFDVGGFADLSFRPSTALSVSVSPSFDHGRTIMQFLTYQDDPLNTAMYGRQYIFAQIQQRSLDLTTRVNLTVSPTLSLQFFVQPFIATGAYNDFKELAVPRRPDFIHYGQTPGSILQVNRDPVTNDIVSYDVDPDGAGPRPGMNIPNPDYNVRSLRGNAVVRWEYRPGSTLFFVWTQSCGYYSQNPRFAPGSDMRQLCQGRSTNVLAIKANYWLSL